MYIIPPDYRFIVDFFLLFLVIHRDKPEKQEKIERKEPLKGMYLAFGVFLFTSGSKQSNLLTFRPNYV